VFCALSCEAGVTWKQDSSSSMFWTYIFPFSFVFPPVPLVRHLLLFFLASGIRVFPNFSELDHGYCSFEKGSTVPLLCSCRRRNSVKGCSNTASSLWFCILSFLSSLCLPVFYFCLSVSPPFSSVFFLTLSLSVSSFSSFCSLSFSSVLSPLLSSVPPLAFIVRGRRRFVVTAGVHHGGEGCQPLNVLLD